MKSSVFNAEEYNKICNYIFELFLTMTNTFNTRSGFFWIPLNYAAVGNSLKSIYLLLRNAADINENQEHD